MLESLRNFLCILAPQALPFMRFQQSLATFEEEIDLLLSACNSPVHLVHLVRSEPHTPSFRPAFSPTPVEEFQPGSPESTPMEIGVNYAESIEPLPQDTVLLTDVPVLPSPAELSVSTRCSISSLCNPVLEATTAFMAMENIELIETADFMRKLKAMKVAALKTFCATELRMSLADMTKERVNRNGSSSTVRKKTKKEIERLALALLKSRMEEVRLTRQGELLKHVYNLPPLIFDAELTRHPDLSLDETDEETEDEYESSHRSKLWPDTCYRSSEEVGISTNHRMQRSFGTQSQYVL